MQSTNQPTNCPTDQLNNWPTEQPTTQPSSPLSSKTTNALSEQVYHDQAPRAGGDLVHHLPLQGSPTPRIR